MSTMYNDVYNQVKEYVYNVYSQKKKYIYNI